MVVSISKVKILKLKVIYFQQHVNLKYLINSQNMFSIFMIFLSFDAIFSNIRKIFIVFLLYFRLKI